MTQNQLRYWEGQEVIRHNKAMEDLEKGKLSETNRHALVTEQEAGRANLENEAIARRRNDIQMFSAASTDRHYLGSDLTNYFGTVTQRAETQRHDLFNESLDQKRQDLAELQRATTVRENERNRSLEREKLNEQRRSNRVNEGIKIGQTVISGAQALLGRGGISQFIGGN